MSQNGSDKPSSQAQGAQDAALEQALRLLDGLLELPPEHRDQALLASGASEHVAVLVKRMLAAHDGPSGPLDKRLWSVDPNAGDSAGALKGRRLGRWRLEQPIGQGGMAVVYRAVSVEAPMGQEAAIKVFTLGAVATGGRERFLREQQLLSRLNHSYIVPLYDAGIADDGTLWMALALVEGERIDEWCRQRGLDLEARIDLLLQVSQALAYAHRNLVVHRDIKPSNVLVDGEGHVRLLDFGLARLTDEFAAEGTGTAMRALTPEYAAPEQFVGAPPSTAMDVYGLGALAYRLLAGQAPRGGQGLPDTRTSPPSRVVKQDVRLPEPARKQLAKRLRGDLDTIVMKALAYEPERRYASIDAMAEDLKRWRERRPIEAFPPSAWYGVGKFVMRNKTGVAAAVAVVLSVLLGLVLAIWQAERAQRQAARATAVRNFVQSMFDPVREGVTAGKTPSIGELVSLGAKRLEATSDLGDAERIDLLNMFSRLHESVGDLPSAAKLSEQAVRRARTQLDPDDPAAIDALATRGYIATRLEHFADAKRDLEEAQRRMRRAGIRGEARVDLLDALAILKNSEGQWDEVMELSREALAERLATWGDDDARVATGYDNLGYALEGAARYSEAIEAWHQGYVLKLKHGDADTIDVARSMHGEASSLWRAGRLRQAKSLFDKTSAVMSTVGGNPQFIHAVQAGKLCSLEGALADQAARAKRCREAEQITRAAFSERHPLYADNLVGYASGQIEAGDLAGARAALSRAQPLYRDSSNDAFRRGRLHSEFAEIDLLENRPDRALQELKTATVDLRTRAYWILPALADARQLLACTLVDPTACPAGLEAKVKAEAALRAPDAHPQMLEADVILARVALARGDAEPARAMLKAAITRARRELRADHPRILEAALWLAAADAASGDCIGADRQRDQADALQRRAYPQGHPFMNAPRAALTASPRCRMQ